MFYTYILKKGENSSFYIGYTGDLRRRIKQHGPCELLYYEAYLTKKQAMEREGKLKQYGSAWRALKKRITSIEGGVMIF